MKKLIIITSIIYFFTIIGLVVWTNHTKSQIVAELSAFASTTNAAIATAQISNNQILNLRNGGNIASSTDFIIAVYNASLVIQQQLNNQKR